jgi:hypothetical protein
MAPYDSNHVRKILLLEIILRYECLLNGERLKPTNNIQVQSCEEFGVLPPCEMCHNIG